MPLKTGAPRGVIVCNRAFNIRKIGARGRNLLPMGFFSILRFNMRKEQIARFSQPRNPRGTRSQRNKRAPSGSAKQHIQYKPSGSAQSAQSQRQCAVGAVRAENFALRTFRAIFFERQCVWRGRQCAPINKKPFRGTTRARAPPENNCPFF